MQVYLVQHGQAVPRAQNIDRPLSDAGRAQVERLARHLATRFDRAIGMPIAEVHHSGKLRAQQTAEILAQHIAPSAPVCITEGLSPNDDPEILVQRLQARRSESSAIMLVGHLPHLAQLVGLLTTGRADQQPVRFRNAGVVRLSWDGHWAVDWVLWPELAD